MTVFKNFKRNFTLLYWVTRIQLLKRKGMNVSEIEYKPMKKIMEINLWWRLKLFENDKAKTLLRKIVQEFVKYGKENNFQPVFIFLPQKDDIIFIKNNYHFYKEFVKDLRHISNLYVIDITEKFLHYSNLDDLYSDDNEYGGHFSKKGNYVTATIIHEELKNCM